MITTFSKVNGNIKLDTNDNVNSTGWLDVIIPMLGQVWDDDTFVFLHKHAALKLGFGIQGEHIHPAVLVYASNNNDSVRIFMKVNNIVTEVFAEDGDIMFDNPQEAIQYVEHVEVLDAVDEIADVVLSALLAAVKEKNETTLTNDAAASAKAIVDDLIAKYGLNADAIYRRNGKQYIIRGASTLYIINNNVPVLDLYREMYIGRIDQMSNNFMQALHTAENLVKIYNL